MAAAEKVERGEGRKVQTEIPLEVAQRMKLEILRRERQGVRATMEGLVLEFIQSNVSSLPRLPEENEVAL